MEGITFKYHPNTGRCTVWFSAQSVDTLNRSGITMQDIADLLTRDVIGIRIYRHHPQCVQSRNFRSGMEIERLESRVWSSIKEEIVSSIDDRCAIKSYPSYARV